MTSTENDYSEKTDVMRWAPEAVSRFETATAEWRREGERIRRFKAGKQWTKADLDARDETHTPSLVFNFFANYVNALTGVQIRNRSYLQFKDLGPEDYAVSRHLNLMAQATMSDAFEDEISDAFEDVACTGIGVGFVTTTHQNGMCMATIERVSPFEMAWDPAACQRNLRDRRWCARRKRYSRREMIDVWGKAKADRCAEALAETSTRVAVSTEVDRELPFEVTHFQWQRHEKETRFRVTGPAAVKDFSEAQFRRVEPYLTDRSMVRIDEYENIVPVYRQVMFCGDVRLEDETPLPFGFTYPFMTGFRDHDDTFHSPMRAAIDPQCFANMIFSTAVNDYMKSGKGIMAEEGAADDMDEFARTFADASKVKRLAPGGLNRVRQLDGAPMSPALPYFFETARSSIPSILGINAEVMGMVTAEQSNVLERTRQDASLTAFQSLFASERMFRKEVGRLLLGFMTRYYGDDAFVRVCGPEVIPHLPAIQAVDVARADIQIDQEPRTVSQRAEALAALQRLGEQMGAQAAPTLLPIVMKYLPLPPSDAKAIEEGMRPRPDPAAQAETAKTMAEVQNLQAKTQEILARIQNPGQSPLAPVLAERAKQETQAQAAHFRALDDAREAELSLLNHQQTLDQAAQRDRLDAAKAARGLIGAHLNRMIDDDRSRD